MVAPPLSVDDVKAEHVQIGSVLGSDGKMFKTRSGASIKLTELLDEAVVRAEAVIADPQAGLDALLAENPAIPAKFAEASLDAYVPLFEAGADQYGSFNADDLESLSQFMVDNDLASKAIAPARYATNEFVEGSN